MNENSPQRALSAATPDSTAVRPPPAETTSEVAGRIVRRLLGVSTVYKVLLANVLLAVAGAVIATVISIGVHSPDDGTEIHVHWRAFWYLLAVGVPGAFFINLAVLRLAFRPLSSLVQTMEAVSQGHSRIRAREGLISDPLTNNMIGTFNRMLDELESSREDVAVLAGKVVAAQEEERRRLSRDLHDNAGQVLTLAVLAVNSIKLCEDPAEIGKRASEAEEIISQAVEEVRRAALELRPVMLDDLGLAPALQWYVQQTSKAIGIPVELQVSGVKRRFPPGTEVTIYRVVQEALTNATKHAQASRVTISLEHDGDTLRATVSDDGQGFDQAKVGRGTQSGLGLFSMKERVALLGGTLAIESQPGKGTRVTAELPVAAG